MTFLNESDKELIAKAAERGDRNFVNSIYNRIDNNDTFYDYLLSLALQFIKDKNEMALRSLILYDSNIINHFVNRLLEDRLSLSKLEGIFMLIKQELIAHFFNNLCVAVAQKIILTDYDENLLDRFLLQVIAHVSSLYALNRKYYSLEDTLYDLRLNMVWNFARVNKVDAVHNIFQVVAIKHKSKDDNQNYQAIPQRFLEAAISGFAREGHVESVRTYLKELNARDDMWLFLKNASSGLIACDKVEVANQLLNEFGEKIGPEYDRMYGESILHDYKQRNQKITKSQLLAICSRIEKDWLRDGLIRATNTYYFAKLDKQKLLTDARKINSLLQINGMRYHKANKFYNLSRVNNGEELFPIRTFDLLPYSLHVWLLQGITTLSQVIPLEVILKINAFLLGITEEQIMRFSLSYYKAASQKIPQYSGGVTINLFFSNSFSTQNCLQPSQSAVDNITRASQALKTSVFLT